MIDELLKPKYRKVTFKCGGFDSIAFDFLIKAMEDFNDKVCDTKGKRTKYSFSLVPKNGISSAIYKLIIEKEEFERKLTIYGTNTVRS